MLIDKIRDMYENSRISQNTAPKILSLLISFLLWIFVMDQVNPEQIKLISDIPVTLLNVEELENNGLVLMDSRDEFFISAKVLGRRNDLLNISAQDIRLSADVSGYGKGENQIPVDIKSFPGNVTVDELSSTSLAINLDRVVELPKLVEIKLNGEIPSGHVKDGVIINPEEVLVKGPESIVNTVDKLVGEVEIEGVVQDIQRDVVIKAINIDGKNVPDVTIKDKIVRVDYLIDELKTINIRPVIKGNVSSEYFLVDYSVNPEKVTIKGDSEILEQIENIITKPVDVSSSTYSFEKVLELQLPEGVQTMYLDVPIKIKVNIEKILEKSYEVPISSIKVINLPEPFVTNLSSIEDVLTVSVKGVESSFESFNIENVALEIDAKDFIIGRNVANIVAKSEDRSMEISVNPSNLFLVVSQEQLDQ